MIYLHYTCQLELDIQFMLAWERLASKLNMLS